MTNKSTGIQTKVPGVFVEISRPCKRTWRKNRFVSSSCLSFGALKLRALVTDRVKANELYLPMNSTDNETQLIS